MMLRQNILHRLLVLGVLLGVSCIMYLTSKTNGEFWWSDAPRHALNTIFCADLLKDMPLTHLKNYAYDYYFQYPALTILFYPPLFYVTAAPFVLMFGATNGVIQGIVIVHFFFLALGVYRLSRFWFSVPLSLALSVAFCFLPDIAKWARQIMLEIPSLCFFIWSIFFFLKFLQGKKDKYLYLTTLFILLSMYTKFTAIFIIPVFALFLLWEYRLDLFRKRVFVLNIIILCLCMLPLVYLTLYFGKTNYESMTNISDAPLSKLTLENWLIYLKFIPSQIGLVLTYVLIASCLISYVWTKLQHRDYFAFQDFQKKGFIFLCAWYVSGYIFFSYISLKQSRYSLYILYPLLFLVFFAVDHLRKENKIWSTLCAFLIAVFVMVSTLLYYPAPFVTGYRESVDFISDKIPSQTNVMISAYRDGSFIANMRMYAGRNDVSIFRSDKLFLHVNDRKSLGVGEKNFSEDEILEIINRNRISYVVAQDEFWIDVPQMKRVDNVLKSSHFQKVFEIIPTAFEPIHESKIIVYKNLSKLPAEAIREPIDIPKIGGQIEKHNQ